MKEKAYLVESIRRAWLMNIINFYGLIILLPFYILTRGGVLLVFIYALILSTVGIMVIVKLSVRSARRFRIRVMDEINRRDILSIAYNAFYGVLIPQVSLLFVPIIITVTMAVSIVDIPVYIRIISIFTVFLALVLGFTYRNVRVIRMNIDYIFRYLRST